MALIKKNTFFKFLFFIIYLFFLPPFRRPSRMTAPLAFAYTAYVQSRLCKQQIVYQVCSLIRAT